MFEYFKKRRGLKQELVQQVKQAKKEEQSRKATLKNLSEDELKKEKNKHKQRKQEQKSAQKAAFKKMTRQERRQAKRKNRMYRKIKNRPRRFVGWSLVVIILLTIVVKIRPTISDMYQVMSGKELTITTDSKQAKAARIEGEKVAEKISDEGIVLLKNQDQHLPLASKKVNVFGVSALDLRYGGGGSGAADVTRAVGLFDGLKNAGIEYNAQLYDFYQKVAEDGKGSSKNDTGIVQVVKGMLNKKEIDEPAIDYLKEKTLKQAQAFSKDALIVVSSDGTEASDLTHDQLKLTENKMDLIKKVSEKFENITLIINAGNAIELGFIDEIPAIKSVVWIGTPGPLGAQSLGKILAGKLNPSGRLTDTYAYNSQSAPASVNFGNYKYDNVDKAFLNYQEGIYVGYRYYETYYENDEKGYQEAVQFPYGYGLSYTNFDWKVTNKKLTKEQMTVNVDVTNTGNQAGKDVVQLYYSAPYKKGEIEKSAIELAAYEKTKLLKPGEKQTLELTFATRDMASYDMSDTQAYVLDEGRYTIKLAKNVHEIVESFDFDLPEKMIYKEDADTNTAYKNQFDVAKGELTYLSRNEWEKTYPSTKELSYTAPESVVEALNEKVQPSKAKMPNMGVDHGLKLEELKGLDFDDPKWSQFLDQLTLTEMKEYVTHGAYTTQAIERLGIPKAILMDGPAGFSFFFKKVEAAAYPTEVVIASTWNNQLAYEMGTAVGNEAKAYGIQGWYAPGMNLHRTAQGGRNFEYFSEDPLLSGKMSAAMIKGAQEEGIIVFMKHFALNDQETNARSGIMIWSNEQTIRELYLKPFEITVKEAQPLGAMSSFSYIGTKWAGGNPELLNNVLRDEWGFDGFVSSDAVFDFMEAPTAIRSGNDLMLDVMSASKNVKRLNQAYKEDPSGIANGLRDSVHHIFYTLLKTDQFE
ncbi:hypothetical protein A5881_000734 [Enterococcus termitis]|nr:hypothetical protein A5881_000940 [Enterococcus termitis]